jgi:hypothetical protein
MLQLIHTFCTDLFKVGFISFTWERFLSSNPSKQHSCITWKRKLWAYKQATFCPFTVKQSPYTNVTLHSTPRTETCVSKRCAIRNVIFYLRDPAIRLIEKSVHTYCKSFAAVQSAVQQLAFHPHTFRAPRYFLRSAKQPFSEERNFSEILSTHKDFTDLKE